MCVRQISLSVTEELHIICFNTVFQYKDLTVPLQVQVFPRRFPVLKTSASFSNLTGSIVLRPPPSRWSSSPTPASSRAPGRPSSGSTWSARTPRSNRSPDITRAWLRFSSSQRWNCLSFHRTSCSSPTVPSPPGRSSERCWAGSFSLPPVGGWWKSSWGWSPANSSVKDFVHINASVYGSTPVQDHSV